MHINPPNNPAIGSVVTGGTPGSVLFVGSSSAIAQDNTNLFWDDANNRLGVGGADPAYPLDVNGEVRVRGANWLYVGTTVAKGVRANGFGYDALAYRGVQVGAGVASNCVFLNCDVSANTSGGFFGYETVIGNAVPIIAPNGAGDDYRHVLSISSANVVRLGNQGAFNNHAVSITDAGNVGVNAESPDAKFVVKGSVSQSENLQSWQDSSDVVHGTVSENGYFTTRKTAAPADAELSTSELAWWFDPTPAATKAMFKCKDSAGTVKTGSVTLT